MPLAPILLSARGLTGQREPTLLRSGDLSVAQNADFSVPGLVQKEGGSTLLATLATPSAIIGGLEYWPTEALQRRVIATADGRLLKDDMTGAFATTLKSGLNTSYNTVHQVISGAEGLGRARKLFHMTGNNPVQVLAADGLTTTDLATPAADWTGVNQPTFMFDFRGFRAAGGVLGNQHFLYGSLVTDHENFVGTPPTIPVLGLLIYPAEGRRVVAGISALGRGWVLKWPRGVYWIDDDNAAITGWFAKPLTRDVGAAPTPWACAQIEDAALAFISDSGHIILVEETAGSISGAVPLDLTKELNLLDVIRSTFDISRLDRSQLQWYKEKKQLIATFAAQGSTTENRRLVIDLSGSRPRAEISTKDTMESLWFEFDTTPGPAGGNVQRPRYGDQAGRVYKTDQIARAVAGAPYVFNVRTAPTDFSDLKAAWAAKKAFYRLHLEFVPQGSFPVTCDIIIDGLTKGTVTFNMGGGGASLPFTLPANLGGFDLRRRSREIGGDGYTIAFNLLETGANLPQLARAWVEFDVLGMTP